MVKKTGQFFRNLYRLFTSDLTLGQFENLFSVELRGMYHYYARDMKSVEGEKNGFRKALKFAWYLFIAFLQKLTPARRLLFILALIFLILRSPQFDFTFYSVLILIVLLALEMADKLITKDELEIAKEIQLSLQPKAFPPETPYEVAAFSEAAKNVGGDYYDFIPLQDGSNLVIIGDVSGNGISAALYMVKVQTMLQLFARETPDVEELLIRLNHHLFGQLKRNYFLTISLLRLYPNGKAELCRAGQPPAVHYERAKRETRWIQPKGAAIGLAPSENGSPKSEKSFDGMLERQKFRLQEGDILLLYSDGLVETVNRGGSEFGSNRLAGLLKAFPKDSAELIKQRLVGELQEFRAGAELMDDTTLVVIKKKA
ncbi:MAG: PP2C family protein-serine/threonine phosphatase [Bacteroidota bacterium]